MTEFAEKFRTDGPGAVGSDLDHGLKILQEFRKELNLKDSARSNFEFKVIFILCTRESGLIIICHDVSGLHLNENMEKFYKIPTLVSHLKVYKS